MEVEKRLSKLNELYKKAEDIDREIFAEQRSNLLLVSGEHFTKLKSKFWDRVRDSKDSSDQQKLRVMKNHVQKIVKTYVNNIISHSPSVAIVPSNSSELQDQKTAEMYQSAWSHIKKRQSMVTKIIEYASDFIDIGEVAVKVFWDPSKGDLLGYAPELDEEGNPIMGLDGQMMPSKNPVFSGDLVFERIFCFNLLRAPEASSIAESPYLIYRKMVEVSDLKARYKSDPVKSKYIQASQDDTYKVFDYTKSKYTTSENQCMLKEYYWRPCLEYPNGYFYIATEYGILEEGELPFGIYPIYYEGFDEIKTTPRHRSIIKQLRPYQVEINREASQQAMNSIVHGDDKVFTLAGSKLSPTAMMQPGMKNYSYTGAPPTIISGRTGQQFLETINSNISEMYAVANVVEDTQEIGQNTDAYALLFRSIKNKKKFIIYTQKFERFLCNITEAGLEIFKNSCSVEQIIPLVGRKEIVNIQEFKIADKLDTRIEVEPMSDDIDSQMGKQLSFSHVLQYVGNQLDKEEIGKIIRAMPFANADEAFEDFTIDYDAAKNDILALERGEFREPNRYDNHVYMIKKLVARIKMSDFRYLDPKIQELFHLKIQAHEMLEAQIQAEIQAAKNDYIPTDGYLITCQMKYSGESGEEKQVRLPYAALDWLIKQLESQGASLDKLADMQSGAVAEIAGMVMGMQQPA